MVDLSHFLVGDFNPFRIATPAQIGLNEELFGGRRCSNQIHYNLMTNQGAASPVSGDVTKHPVFDLIPFAGSRWKMTKGKLQPQLIGQLLQTSLPQADPVAVAASGISRNQQMNLLAVLANVLERSKTRFTKESLPSIHPGPPVDIRLADIPPGLPVPL